MNETLKGAAHIGAELAAAKADLQLEMERHRKTWRQLEQVTGLLKRAKLKLWTSPGDTLPEEIKAALSQQAEPDHVEDMRAMAEPAPAQDEREAFEAHLVAHHGYQPYTLRSLREGDSYPGVALPLAWSVWQARPAQTEQQPVAHMALNSSGFPEKCLPTDPNGFPVYAAPIAHTAPQPEQSGLVGQVCGGDGTHNTVNVAVVGAVPWGELRIGTPVRLIQAPATPSPATAPSHE